MGVLPENRKGTIKVGKAEDLAARVGEAAKHFGKAATIGRGQQINEVHQIARRVTQKLDKIKRALSNTTKDVEDIEAYLKDKLDGYRNAR